MSENCTSCIHIDYCYDDNPNGSCEHYKREVPKDENS